VHRDPTQTTWIAGEPAVSRDYPDVPRIRRTRNPSAPIRVSLDWAAAVNEGFRVALRLCLIISLGPQVNESARLSDGAQATLPYKISRFHRESLYGWFTEGFDIADLQEAKTWLDGLAG
jgi:hypothetical protein